MKRVLLLVPVVVSIAVLGAHYLRFGNLVGVGAALLLLGLLFLQRPWVARLAQVVLVFGSIQWVWTIYRLVRFRAAMDAPYTRMAIILGVVAAVSLCSAWLFQTTTLRKAYRITASKTPMVCDR